MGKACAFSCADGPGVDRRDWATTQLTAKRVKSWIVCCWRSVGTRAHTWVGAMCGIVETVETIMKPPPMGIRPPRLPARIILGVLPGEEHRSGRWGGATRSLTATLDEAHNLAQPLEGEQWGRVLGRGSDGCPCIVGGTHSECCVGPIRELDDQVRINALPDPDQRDPLAAQRVMGMG